MSNEQTTPCPFGGVLKFDPKWHTYHYEDGDTRIKLSSVTKWLKAYKQPFDEDRWSKHVATKEGITQVEVLARWAEKRDRSCEAGHAVHATLENIINRSWKAGVLTIPPLNFRGRYVNWERAGRQWLVDHNEWVAWNACRTEWQVCNPDWGVAGTIDFFCNAAGKDGLVDWKTNEAIKQENSFDKMEKPFDDLDDCNFHHYALQLSMYKLILEQKYGKTIQFLKLVHLKPDKTYIVYDVPDLSDRIRVILEGETVDVDVPSA